MFCRYCGKSITDRTKPCSYCGKEQGSLRASNGYFGILETVDGSEKAEPVRKENLGKESFQEFDNLKEELAGYQNKFSTLRKQYRRMRKIFFITVAVFGVILTASVVINLAGHLRMKQSQETYHAEIEVMKEDMQDMQAFIKEQASLEAEIERLGIELKAEIEAEIIEEIDDKMKRMKLDNSVQIEEAKEELAAQAVNIKEELTAQTVNIKEELTAQIMKDVNKLVEAAKADMKGIIEKEAEENNVSEE